MSFISKSLPHIGKTKLLRVAAALSVIIFVALLNPSFAQLPISSGAPSVGQKAPTFTLPDQNGKLVSLADLLKQGPGGAKPSGVALVFYRGYW
jgi:hypothetical protein